MLEVHENEIALRKWSGGIAQLRTSEGSLVTRGVRGSRPETLRGRLSPLACAVDHAATFAVDVALVACQWQHPREPFPCTHGQARRHNSPGAD